MITCGLYADLPYYAAFSTKQHVLLTVHPTTTCNNDKLTSSSTSMTDSSNEYLTDYSTMYHQLLFHIKRCGLKKSDICTSAFNSGGEIESFLRKRNSSATLLRIQSLFTGTRCLLPNQCSSKATLVACSPLTSDRPTSSTDNSYVLSRRVHSWNMLMG